MSNWDDFEKAIRDLREAVDKTRAVEAAAETDLARKIRTGSHEAADLKWTIDELEAWLSSADTPDEAKRITSEFAEASTPRLRQCQHL